MASESKSRLHLTLSDKYIQILDILAGNPSDKSIAVSMMIDEYLVSHEKQLIELIDEERLKYAGSMVLGLILAWMPPMVIQSPLLLKIIWMPVSIWPAGFIADSPRF